MVTEPSKESISERSVRKLRKFTVEQRQRIVAESFSADTTVRAVAARYGLRPNQLSTWRTASSKNKVIATAAKGPRFAAVRPSSPISDGVIEMDISSGCIRIRGEVSSLMLREAVGLMR